MTIIYSEIISSGISEADFDAISQAELGHTKQVTVYRQNPKFTLHTQLSDNDIVDSNFWAACASNGYLIIFYHRTDRPDYINFQFMPIEDDDPSILSAFTVGNWGTCAANTPICMLSDGTNIREYHLDTDNTMRKTVWSTPITSVTLTITTYSTYDFSNDAVEWIEATEDAFGSTVYVVISDPDTNNRRVYIVGPTSLIDTGIVWPDELTGFSVQSFLGPLDDSTDPLAGSDVRHCITLASSLPNMYQQKLVAGVPQETVVLTGGIVSYVVRPPNGDRPIQVSRYHEVQAFDQVTSVQYRSTAQLTALPSMEHPDNDNDTLWLTTIGKNGDLNGNLEDFGFEAVYYYSSRDGKHWSQDQIVPIDDIIDVFPDDLEQGMKFVAHGNYVYLVSHDYVLRTLGCGQFGNPHPDLTLDVTKKVLGYNSNASDTRQDNINLDNTDGALYDTCLGEPGTFRVVTKFGGIIDDHEYLFQVTTQEVDTLEDTRDRPRVIRLVSRDYMAQITDKTAAVDAIQYDNTAIGVDSFDAIGSATDAGLSHSDAVKGTWGTTDKNTTGAAFNTLILKSRYETGIVFNTQLPGLVDDGCAQATGQLPNPTTYTTSPSSSNAPSFIGVNFRSIDKDNLWYCVFNYWTQMIELGYRSSGVDTVKESVAPSASFLNSANTYQAITIRVEFVGPRVRVYHSDPDNDQKMIYLFSYLMLANTLPTFKPMIGQGHIGVYASGYSDQDQFDEEPEPTILGFDASDSGWGSANDFVPTRGVFCMSDAALVYRISSMTGVPRYVDISPTNAIVPTHDYPAMIMDPWAYERLIVANFYEILGLDNFKTAMGPGTWDVLYRPDASTNPYTSDTPMIWYNISGSINREGWFGWIEYCGFSPGTDSYWRYAFTTDNFATVEFSDLPFRVVNGYDSSSNQAVGCFNTNTYGLIALATCNLSTAVSDQNPHLLLSEDWGRTFIQVPGLSSGSVHLSVSAGGVQIPYSDFGGGENRTNQLIWSYNSGDMVRFLPDGTIIQPHGSYPVDGNFGNTWSSHWNSFTLDANYGYVMNIGQANQPYLYRTEDGWLTSISLSCPSFPQNINGWPTNRNYLLMASRTHTGYTTDAGATFNDILLGGSPFGSVVGIADLTELYDTEVHPS